MVLRRLPIRPEGSQIIRILTRKIAKISGWTGNFGNSRNFRFNRKFSLHGSTWSSQSPMVQRAIAVMPALKTSQKLARNSQHIQSKQGIKMFFSTHISPMILVIIFGIWLELEIKISHLFDLVKPHLKGTLRFATRILTPRHSWTHSRTGAWNFLDVDFASPIYSISNFSFR